MASKGLVAQTTRETPTVPLRESIIAPALLPVCCLCSKVRDETGSSPDHELWVTPRMYRQTHRGKLAKFPLTHTFCPVCFIKFMDTVRQYRPEVGSSP
jgi:hypothetical protein